MGRKQFLICLGAALLWTAFIFSQSLKPAGASSVDSTRALGLLQRILPFGLTEHIVRKLGHFTEFGVLGVLSGMLFCGGRQRMRTGFLFAVMTGMSVALCDETIQLFVEGRNGQIPDVWLDAAGNAAGAALALSVLAVWRRKARGARHDRDTA